MGPTDAGRALRETVSQDLRQAQKARDLPLMATYRSLLSAIDNAEAVPANPTYDPSVGLGAGEVDRQQLDVTAVNRVVESEIRERVEAAEQYRAAGAEGAAADLDAECDVLRRYLSPGTSER